MATQSPATKYLVDQWKTLLLDESRVLVKRWVVLSGKHSDVWAVVVPQALRAEMLKELHAGLVVI